MGRYCIINDGEIASIIEIKTSFKGKLGKLGKFSMKHLTFNPFVFILSGKSRLRWKEKVC
jgi:hypothetical protein